MTPVSASVLDTGNVGVPLQASSPSDMLEHVPVELRQDAVDESSASPGRS